MDLGLIDKVVVVTGGGSGLGAGITRACLAEGARVVVLGRRTDAVSAFMAEMDESRARCAFIPMELGDEKQCAAAIRGVMETHGSIYGVVNNAGTNDRIGLETGSPQKLMSSLQDNLLHYYAVLHYALPALKQTRGAVVNIASKVAVTGQGGTSAYAAAKGAQLALTREWAVELLPYGIRVNAIVPAEVMTPAYREWIETFNDAEDKLRAITAHIPLDHRMTTPQEIGAAAAFLLSPLCSAHTTGQQLFVDGGYVHLDRALT